jgi:ABC-type multidrug transport system ATPase subunit
MIQEEAEAGVTVFVTTHFLEEVDYCDWVSFIDAGRLIANAEPETLRRRYSDGYRIELQASGAARQRAAALLQPWSLDSASTADALSAHLETLEPPLLRDLDEWRETWPGVEVQITQTSMTDVFRRVLAEERARI